MPPAVPDPSRDLNHDGIVDAADNPIGDRNHDGIIDSTDDEAEDRNHDHIIDSTDREPAVEQAQAQNSVGASMGWSKNEQCWERPETAQAQTQAQAAKLGTGRK
ncbi:MAG: hypothetical protein JWO94_3715 [Verrucomicrobiaceae bacterium]|nr:hypothetical protein [Verrucomicrobiaceae bacterium]